MPDIVITAGTAAGSVLALAEAITAKIGCKAYILCTDEITSKILSSSKFIEEVFLIKKIDEESYIGSIKQWRETKAFEVLPILYFTTDTSCYYVDNYRGWFEQNFKVCLPSSHIIKSFTQKGLAEPEAFKNGLIIPKTLVIKNKVDISIVVQEFIFPVILKPQATYLKNSIPFKIKVIKDKEEFLIIATNYVDSERVFLCQEFIPGGNDSSFYYLFYRGKNGEIIENIGKKILQSTPNGGIMLKGKSEFNEELSKICKRFLENINYQGIGGIEFKQYNNNFYFIEMSVRLEGFFKISEISNSPISLVSYYDLTQGTISKELLGTKQKDGYIYMTFLPVILNHLKNKKIKLLVVDGLRAIFDPKFKLDVFSYKSIKPFMLQFIYLFKRKS